MNKLLIAGLGAALLTLAGCATTASTSAGAAVPWEADESTLPAIPPLASAGSTSLPWAADESALPAIAPTEAFTDYDMLPN